MKRYYISLLLLFALTAGCKHQSFDELCQKEAQEDTRRMCPKQITAGVILDSISYRTTDHTLCYYYTMSGQMDNREAIERGKAKFRDALRKDIANSLDLKKYKDYGISFRYLYLSKSSKTALLDLTFSRKDY